jgi:hypothetical protein
MDTVATKVRDKMTDGILGKELLDKDITPARTVSEDQDLKEKIRNKIVFWSCVVGGTCQILNLIYVTLFVGKYK